MPFISKRALDALKASAVAHRDDAFVAENTLSATNRYAHDLLTRYAHDLTLSKDQVRVLRSEIDELEAGMRVHVTSIRLDAVVVSVDTKSARVKVNASGKELEVPASSILEAKYIEKTPQVRTHLVERTTQASSEIKLIGLRVDEALERLEPFLNSASLSGLDFVRVIHGIGTGALRGAVREFLEEHPLVESFRPGGLHEGGDGATVVTLK